VSDLEKLCSERRVSVPNFDCEVHLEQQVLGFQQNGTAEIGLRAVVHRDTTLKAHNTT